MTFNGIIVVKKADKINQDKQQNSELRNATEYI
jgi:GTP-binding protein EngB required for normal cell division